MNMMTGTRMRVRERLSDCEDVTGGTAMFADRRGVITALAAVPVMAACSPTVRVEAPTEPIEINLNIRIEQEVRIKIERELEQLFEEEDEIF